MVQIQMVFFYFT